jgi:hypothetical protein
LGANGVFAANMYPLTHVFPFLTAGLRAFRHFDGAGANFGKVWARTQRQVPQSLYRCPNTASPPWTFTNGQNIHCHSFRAFDRGLSSCA